MKPSFVCGGLSSSFPLSICAWIFCLASSFGTTNIVLAGGSVAGGFFLATGEFLLRVEDQDDDQHPRYTSLPSHPAQWSAGSKRNPVFSKGLIIRRGAT